MYCNTLGCIAENRAQLYCRIVLQEAWLGTICIAIQSTVLWLEGLQKAGLYRNTTWSIVAGDRAAYVVRQAAVSRHGAGLGSRRARGGAGRAARRAGRAPSAQAADDRRGRARGVASARAAGARARGAQAAGAWARAVGAHGLGARCRGARPGRAGWLWVVHSVHSACFRPGLTRYCS